MVHLERTLEVALSCWSLVVDLVGHIPSGMVLNTLSDASHEALPDASLDPSGHGNHVRHRTSSFVTLSTIPSSVAPSGLGSPGSSRGCSSLAEAESPISLGGMDSRVRLGFENHRTNRVTTTSTDRNRLFEPRGGGMAGDANTLGATIAPGPNNSESDGDQRMAATCDAMGVLSVAISLVTFRLIQRKRRS